MSELLQLNDAIAVYKPMTVASDKTVVIRRGPAQFTRNTQTASSLSNNQVTFNINLNSPSSTIISSYMYQSYTFNVTVAATGLSQTVQSYLADNFALRQYPIASVTNTTTVQCNNQSISSQPSQIVHPLSWQQDFISNEAALQSITPIAPDQCQQYNDAIGSAGKNVLAGYFTGSGLYSETRGSFNSNFQTTTNGTGTWVFNVTLNEPIINPMLAYSPSPEQEGLAYVQLLNINVTFLSNLSRIFSLNNIAAPNISSITCNLTAASLIMEWLTVPLSQQLPPRTLRSFNTIVPFQTTLTPFTSGQQQVVTSQTLSLTQIPKRMWVFITDGATDIATGYTKTDTFFSIQQVSILFNNRTSLMANMNGVDLFNFTMAAENSRLTYTQSQNYVGSVCCIDPVKMFGLLDDESSGVMGQYNFQLTCTTTNISNHTITTPILWVTVANDTVFETNASSISNLVQGFITKEDVLASNSLPANPVQFVPNDIYGGAFLDTLRSYVGKAARFIKNNKLISKGLSLIPHPFAQAASTVASTLGVGGRRTSRREMEERYGLGM